MGSVESLLQSICISMAQMDSDTFWHEKRNVILKLSLVPEILWFYIIQPYAVWWQGIAP